MARLAAMPCWVAVVLIVCAASALAQSNAPAGIVLSNIPPSAAANGGALFSQRIQWSGAVTNFFKRPTISASTSSRLEASLRQRDLYAIEEFDRTGAYNTAVVLTPLERRFEPWVIHLGHVEMTCSILTAIKRRNPLCLIDPTIVQVSF